MIEQHVADRMRAAVEGEPPLGFDPDEVIDQAIKQRRRRRVVTSVVLAMVVEALVVIALASVPGGGTEQVQAGGPGPGLLQEIASAQPSARFEGTAYEEALSLDRPLAHPPGGQSLWVNELAISNPDGERGVLLLMRGQQSMLEVALDGSGDQGRQLDPAFEAEPGIPVTIVLNCPVTKHGCRGVTVKITGMSVRELN